MLKLSIDDLRECPEGFDIVRSSKEAIDYIKTNGVPDIISFDHDLGADDTSMEVVNFIINGVLDGELQIPENFIFFIHSANPVGSENIKRTLLNFIFHVCGRTYKRKTINIENMEQNYYICREK